MKKYIQDFADRLLKAAIFFPVKEFYTPKKLNNKWHDRINELASLPENWNTYGALPPSKVSIDLAHEIVDYLKLIKANIKSISISGDSDILISGSRESTEPFAIEIDYYGDMALMKVVYQYYDFNSLGQLKSLIK